MGSIRSADIVRLLASWFLSFLALLLTAEILPGFEHTSWTPLLLAAAVTGIVGAIVRPVLVGLSSLIGWVAVALATVFGQALVMYLALYLVPGASFDSFWTAVAAAWIAAAFGTVLAWVLSAGTDESFAASLLRIRATGVSDPDINGVLFIQLDGVAFPVMRWALQSGTMPTLRRWVDAGSHLVHEWTVQMPCTTPASQQAILHGTAAGVPAFRWYDRELGRVLVSNRPKDAAIIESRVSTGVGLLADDGVSISNLFSGDAPKASMTMSRLEVSRGSRRTRAVVARFLLRPDGLFRSLTRTFAEVSRERFQAVRQKRLVVHPRVHRSWTFAGLRAFSNGMMRDLNTTLVSEEMMRGARSIYVDYVDYDEIAHHAGGTRIESLASLTALDQVLAVLEQVARKAPRHYHFVVLSDHGQAQGEPFASRHGTPLSELCATLTQSETTGIESSIEGWGHVDAVLEDLQGSETRAVTRRVDKQVQPEAPTPDEALVVLGSGNLGLVYAPEARRLTLEEIEARWPALVPGLSRHPGVGFVSAMAADGPVAIGCAGRHHLATGAVEGTDPLLPFGEHAPAMVLALTSMPEAPDLYVNSALDPGTLEVAAFEPLVGCHGGLGGWQDRGFVLAPPQLLSPSVPIVGGDQLHQHLVGILDSLGHRTQLDKDQQMNPSRTLSLLVGAAALVIVVAGMRSAAGIVAPVMLALALTILFHPVRVRLERRIPSWAATILVLVFAYLIIILFTLTLVVSVGRMADLVSDYDTQAADLTANISDWATDAGMGSDQVDEVAGALDPTRLIDLATSILSGILDVLSNLAFLVILLLFLAFDSANASRLAQGARRHRPHLVDALDSFARGTRSYLGVSALFGLIVAVIDTAVLLAIGIPGAFIWGVLAFVTNFIPNIGFVIGVIPPALIGLLEGGPGLMIAVILLYSLINMVIQSIIQPRYVGDAVGLSTTLTFVSLIFWTWVLGPLGALLAVPMTLFFRAILVEADPDSTWMRPLISGDPGDERLAEGR